MSLVYQAGHLVEGPPQGRGASGGGGQGSQGAGRGGLLLGFQNRPHCFFFFFIVLALLASL